MKRVMLFIATNLAVILVLSMVMNIVFAFTGLRMDNTGGLLVFASIFGFGGAFISLLMSKWMAKRSVGAYVIETPRNDTERWLVDTVRRQAQQAGIGMPEVAMYQSPDMNAFATGANRNDALVAVSTGLLDNMSRDEVEAVLAHEVSHIANGDMVTMTLLQGIINTFVIFAARLIAGAINNATRGNNNSGEGLGTFAYYGIVMVLELVLGFLASFILMWFSRQREFRADAGSARLVGRNKMIGALKRLKMSQESQLDGTMMALGIINKRSISELLMSHPPLDKRIAALQNLN
ncbi:protease HtpX [Bowmanella sp. JS7-9]|uniref:Protease HtpX n=1 Tax=Pseudobowmanella zhangzhouensis TaxID=1537679 RepID=A0ABW1XN18_9ALTE|nr:protease HtpX [Bowmanella sp. JS7-9]TBX23044.1 heat shock protein HtpX [Bowmanella sp. JS7-9]